MRDISPLALAQGASMTIDGMTVPHTGEIIEVKLLIDGSVVVVTELPNPNAATPSEDTATPSEDTATPSGETATPIATPTQ